MGFYRDIIYIMGYITNNMILGRIYHQQWWFNGNNSILPNIKHPLP